MVKTLEDFVFKDTDFRNHLLPRSYICKDGDFGIPFNVLHILLGEDMDTIGYFSHFMYIRIRI